jgi:hypothetical protein
MPHRRSARCRLTPLLALLLALALLPALPSAAGAARGEPEARAPDARLVSVGSSVAVSAGGADCVTRAEYRRARHGMPKRRVHRIFGTSGWLIYLVVNNEEKRGYQMCDPSLRLTVTYLHGELGYKQLRS